MTNLKRQTFSVLAAGAMLLNVASPVLAGTTTLEITGNGAETDNVVRANMENKVEVKQDNKADVRNDIEVNSNTGNNQASQNGAGNVEIKTGDAVADVTVNNTLNSNKADLGCCANNDTTVKVSDNLKRSDNSVYLDNENKTEVRQDNYADVDNKVDVDSQTGRNYADDNIGGDVTIKTGKADTTVKVGTTANLNWAKVGGSSDNGGSLTAYITGNGAKTDNVIDLDLENKVELDQDNDAYVDNDVYVDAVTGKNGADDNGAGNVEIKTGDAVADVTVDNLVNFNAADVNCGCLLDDVHAKIGQNLTESYNTIRADFEDKTEVEQDNDADVDNRLDVDAQTGENDADDNVSGADHDPSIKTGNTNSTVTTGTVGNSNAFGDLGDFDLELPGGITLNFSLDLSALFALNQD